MKIGIDLDNTIICYDDVFRFVAQKEGYGFNGVETKEDVKLWFHDNYMQDVFTEIQGLVYGKYINQASLFNGVKTCLKTWRTKKYELFIISHKTKYPVIGEKINLQESAANYLSDVNILNSDIIPISNLFFEDSSSAKLARISDLGLDFFIDDLPSILKDKAFPKTTRKILFDPLSKNCKAYYDFAASNWSEISQFMGKKSGLSL